jgi:hypothetical protein
VNQSISSFLLLSGFDFEHEGLGDSNQTNTTSPPEHDLEGVVVLSVDVMMY